MLKPGQTSLSIGAFASTSGVGAGAQATHQITNVISAFARAQAGYVDTGRGWAPEAGAGVGLRLTW